MVNQCLEFGRRMVSNWLSCDIFAVSTAFKGDCQQLVCLLCKTVAYSAHTRGTQANVCNHTAFGDETTIKWHHRIRTCLTMLLYKNSFFLVTC